MVSEPRTSGQHWVTIYRVDVEIFHNVNGNFDLLVALKEKPDDHQLYKHLSSGHHVCTKFMATHPVVVEIIQLGPKWWTNTD